jgi:nucleoside-diphosphate-sugar epimerase
MAMPTNDTPNIALVLGLTGAIGSAIAGALAARGWTIRAMTRRPVDQCPVFPFAVDWRQGDALDGAAIMAAAAGAGIIVHGVNPPGYARWREDGLPMLANAIAAAKAVDATLLFPANVYVYSTATNALVDETSPRNPTTRKGQVRLEMEQMLERAAREDGVRVIAVRAGDFFGPGVKNSWFSQAMAKGGRSAKVIQTLTPDDVGHAWAYVPDLAETFARLVDMRADLPTFTLVHFAGHFDATGRMMAESIRRVIEPPHVKIRPFRWIFLWLGAPFASFLREALEMTWLWKKTLALDNTKLRILIGEEPHTPLNDAVRAAIDPAA